MHLRAAEDACTSCGCLGGCAPAAAASPPAGGRFQLTAAKASPNKSRALLVAAAKEAAREKAREEAAQDVIFGLESVFTEPSDAPEGGDAAGDAAAPAADAADLPLEA